MYLRNTLITAVGLDFDFFRYTPVAVFKQLEIMCTPIGLSKAKDFAIGGIYH